MKTITPKVTLLEACKGLASALEVIAAEYTVDARYEHDADVRAERRRVYSRCLSDARAAIRTATGQPELLAALRVCLAEYTKRTWTDPASPTGPAAMIRAAIRTATGQEG